MTYQQLMTATVINFTNSIFTDFNFSLLQKWEYQNKKLIKRQLCWVRQLPYGVYVCMPTLLAYA